MNSGPMSVAHRNEAAVPGRGVSGSFESCDALVVVTLPPPGGGVSLHLESPSLAVCGDRMRRVALETLCALGVTDADVVIRDRGALDCTLAARVETAVRRARASAEVSRT
jgi:citrate lyase subunit gamma (acyl carrier protein)